MTIHVNENCIGCGACVGICEEVFELDENGLSKVKVSPVPEDKLSEVQDAMESCPTSAIVED